MLFFGTFVIPDRLINTDWMKRDWVNPVCLVWPKSQQRDGECGICVLCCVFDLGVKASSKVIFMEEGHTGLPWLNKNPSNKQVKKYFGQVLCVKSFRPHFAFSISMHCGSWSLKPVHTTNRHRVLDSELLKQGLEFEAQPSVTWKRVCGGSSLIGQMIFMAAGAFFCFVSGGILIARAVVSPLSFFPPTGFKANETITKYIWLNW